MFVRRSAMLALAGAALLAALASGARADLVGHWTLDESPAVNGTTIADSSGLGHDGTLTVSGTPADRSVTGVAGGAVSFNGSGDKITASLGSDLSTGNSPFTVTAWINPTAITTAQNYVVSYGTATGGQFFSLGLEDNGSGSSRIRYRAYAGFLDFDASTITVGSGWHQVAAVLPSGSSTLGDFKFYLDGQPMTRLPGGPTGTTLNLQSTPLNIGHSSAAGDGFKGAIDDVQYYNQGLSGSLITTLYNHPGAALSDLPMETTTFSSFVFRTAEADGDSPANSSQFAGPLFVRERADQTQTDLMTRAFVKFDLSALDGNEIAKAELHLHENNKLNNANSANLLIGRVLNAWDATGGTAPDFFDAVAGEFVFGNNGPASAGPAVDIDHIIDVTDILKAWQADPSSNYGFRLALAAGFVGAAFDNTGPYAPYLVVTQVVPEPSTVVLLGCLGLMLLGYRRGKRR